MKTDPLLLLKNNSGLHSMRHKYYYYHHFFWVLFNWLIFQEYSRLVATPKTEPFELLQRVLFYILDDIPVTHPILAKHWSGKLIVLKQFIIQCIKTQRKAKYNVASGNLGHILA